MSMPLKNGAMSFQVTLNEDVHPASVKGLGGLSPFKRAERVKQILETYFATNGMQQGISAKGENKTPVDQTDIADKKPKVEEAVGNISRNFRSGKLL